MINITKKYDKCKKKVWRYISYVTYSRRTGSEGNSVYTTIVLEASLRPGSERLEATDFWCFAIVVLNI